MSTQTNKTGGASFTRWFFTNETCDPCMRWAMFVLRVAVGLMFALAGWGKLMDFDRAVYAAGEMAGFPYPHFFGGCLVAAELVGGILLILGVIVRPVVLIEIFVMAVAIKANWGEGFPGNFPKIYGNVMVIAICAALFVGGGGLLSLMPGGRGQETETVPQAASPNEETGEDD